MLDVVDRTHTHTKGQKNYLVENLLGRFEFLLLRANDAQTICSIQISDMVLQNTKVVLVTRLGVDGIHVQISKGKQDCGILLRVGVLKAKLNELSVK